MHSTTCRHASCWQSALAHTAALTSLNSPMHTMLHLYTVTLVSTGPCCAILPAHTAVLHHLRRAALLQAGGPPVLTAEAADVPRTAAAPSAEKLRCTHSGWANMPQTEHACTMTAAVLLTVSLVQLDQHPTSGYQFTFLLPASAAPAVAAGAASLLCGRKVFS